jgi:hypothetical protein
VLPLLTEAGLEVRIQIGNRKSLYDLLPSDAVDLAGTTSTSEDPRLDSTVIGTEALIAVTLPSKAHLGTDASFLSYDLDLSLIQLWLAANALSVARRPPIVTVPDLRVVRSLVKSGAGSTVLPDYLCETNIDTGQLAEIPAPSLAQRVTYDLYGPRARCVTRGLPTRATCCWALFIFITESSQKGLAWFLDESGGRSSPFPPLPNPTGIEPGYPATRRCSPLFLRDSGAARAVVRRVWVPSATNSRPRGAAGSPGTWSHWVSLHEVRRCRS